MEYSSDGGMLAQELLSCSDRNQIQPTAKLESADLIQATSIEGCVDPILCIEPITSVGHGTASVDVEPGLEFIPTVPEAFRPYVGREFKSEVAATEFYNAYAKLCGFNVRLNQRKMSEKLKIVVFRSFCCSKEGKREKKFLENVNRKRAPKPITRVGCPAELAVKRKDENTWVVTKFVEKHSHELMTPIKPHIVPLCHSAPEEDVSFFDGLREVGGGPPNSLDFVASGSGGPSNLEYIDGDAKSTFGKKWLATHGKEVVAVYKFFKKVASEDPSFSYDIQIDDEARVTAFFWVDGSSKLDYQVFGDVVCFNSTYKTTLYTMPFAPFTGINHHKQSILFGAGLLLNETIEDYKWLFQTWLKAMGGRHPKTIITDQDSAIGVAIAEVFPHTQHRLSMWHELQKVPAYVGYQYREGSTFKGDFNRCIHQTETPDEFERLWATMIKQYELEHNDWLNQIYNIRHVWIPAYVRETFFAGISTTKCNESMKAMFDGYMTYPSTLIGYAMGYQKAVENRRRDEVAADDKNAYGSPLPRTPFDIEKGLIKAYTNEILKDVIEELFQSSLYNTNLVDKSNLLSTFEVTHMSRKEKANVVQYNEKEEKISCRCLLFEFQGIVCRHSFAVFRVLGIDKMPEYCILKRWRRHAKAGLAVDMHNSQAKLDGELLKFVNHNEVGHCLKRLSHEAPKSKRKFAHVKEQLGKLAEELEKMDEDAVSVGQNEISIEQVGTSDDHGLLCFESGTDGGNGLAQSSTDIVLWDPSIIRSNGYSTNKRPKSDKELIFSGKLGH